MADLIDRQALKAIYSGKRWHYLRNRINKLPAVDAVEVVHGLWDDSGRYKFAGGATAVRCSECGCALTVSEYKLNRWNYCPVCGAKMDGERG